MTPTKAPDLRERLAGIIVNTPPSMGIHADHAGRIADALIAAGWTTWEDAAKVADDHEEGEKELAARCGSDRGDRFVHSYGASTARDIASALRKRSGGE